MTVKLLIIIIRCLSRYNISLDNIKISYFDFVGIGIRIITTQSKYNMDRDICIVTTIKKRVLIDSKSTHNLTCSDCIVNTITASAY